VNKDNSIFAVTRRSFQFLDVNTFIPLYKSLVRTHLDFASPVQCAGAPSKMKDIDIIEGIQRRVTKQVPGFKNLSYPERLRTPNLPTLAHRRLRREI
jgi:hypothetical protein